MERFTYNEGARKGRYEPWQFDAKNHYIYCGLHRNYYQDPEYAKAIDHDEHNEPYKRAAAARRSTSRGPSNAHSSRHTTQSHFTSLSRGLRSCHVLSLISLSLSCAARRRAPPPPSSFLAPLVLLVAGVVAGHHAGGLALPVRRDTCGVSMHGARARCEQVCSARLPGERGAICCRGCSPLVV